MALKAKVLGREALTAKLAAIAPAATKYANEVKLQIAQEAAEKMRERAPRGAEHFYAETIEGDFIKNRPNQRQVGIENTKDPDAAGIFAEWIWRFLEFGTAPHSTARKGGTVKGKKEAASGGGYPHPGSRAFPHIFPTWRAMRKKAKQRIQAAVRKGVREAMGK
jgi:hypothetical protein